MLRVFNIDVVRYEHMAKLTKDNVLHVAKLAKLTLTEEEVKKYLSQLAKVVDYISQLEEVDTSDVEPTSQTTGLTNVFRSDEVKQEECLSQEDALSGTDKVHNGYFEVPGIIDKALDNRH